MRGSHLQVTLSAFGTKRTGRSPAQQLYAACGSGRVHGLLAQRRALHMAVRASLVAVQADVHLQRCRLAPPQRRDAMLLQKRH